MLDKVYVVHFSPAGNTRKAALMLAGELAVQVEEYDLTLPLGERRSFAPSDVVIAAGPVYGGRPLRYMGTGLMRMPLQSWMTGWSSRAFPGWLQRLSLHSIPS